MKILTIAFTALTLCGAALAESVDTINAHFTTPILIGDKTLPAGDITFNVLRGSNSVVVAARSQDGTAATVLVNRVYDGEEGGHTTVVLGRHGNALKLERIWLDDRTGFAVLQPAQ
jgi:hypothetical protein